MAFGGVDVGPWWISVANREGVWLFRFNHEGVDTSKDVVNQIAFSDPFNPRWQELWQMFRLTGNLSVFIDAGLRLQVTLNSFTRMPLELKQGWEYSVNSQFMVWG